MLLRMISIEKQGHLAQMETQAKIAMLLSVDELERVELCQVCIVLSRQKF